MEDALRAYSIKEFRAMNNNVLILVLMEDALRADHPYNAVMDYVS